MSTPINKGGAPPGGKQCRVRRPRRSTRATCAPATRSAAAGRASGNDNGDPEPGTDPYGDPIPSGNEPAPIDPNAEIPVVVIPPPTPEDDPIVVPIDWPSNRPVEERPVEIVPAVCVIVRGTNVCTITAPRPSPTMPPPVIGGGRAQVRVM